MAAQARAAQRIHLVAGTAEKLGRRASMEDRATTITSYQQLLRSYQAAASAVASSSSLSLTTGGGGGGGDSWPDVGDDVPFDLSNESVGLVGIFDGHGGHVCAEYVRRHLHLNLLRSRRFRDDPGHALRDAVLSTDDEFLQAAREHHLERTSGACLVAALIMGSRVWVANVGDSRAVVATSSGCVALTTDHRPSLAKERARIEANGGWVARANAQGFDPGQSESGCVRCCFMMCPCCCPKGPLRVYPGGLAVSRTIGDLTFKDDGLITAEPEVREYELDLERDEFILLACDGIFDVFTNKEAVRVVREALASGASAEDAAMELADAAYNAGSTDNLSVTVVLFKDPEAAPE